MRNIFWKRIFLSQYKRNGHRYQIPQIWISLGTKFHLRGHTFMKFIKIYQFRDPNPKPIISLHSQNWTKDLLFDNNRFRKHVTNCKIPQLPFCLDVINVWSLKRKLFQKGGSCFKTKKWALPLNSSTKFQL